MPQPTARTSAPAAPLLRPVTSLTRSVRTRPRDPWVQGSLALQWQVGDVDAVPRVDAPLRLVPEHADDGATDPAVAQVPTRSADLPDPAAWVAQLVQAVLEVLARERPRQQLVRWLSPTVYADLSRHVAAAPPAAPGRGAGLSRRTVSSVHISEPADGVVEACAVAVGGPRARAVAVRIEGWDGRWRCTRLAVL